MEGGAVERWLPRGFTNAPVYEARARDRARADEGRDAQPPDRDLAVPRRRAPAPAARSATKARPAAARSPRPASPASPCRNLHLPGTDEPWEQRSYGKPEHIASPLQIMTEGPLGGAAFNNEFGRPNLRRLLPRLRADTSAGVRRGYHKPIMIAGGLGAIDATQTHKIEFPAGTLLIQLGGPGMRIGMGGGAASSMAAGATPPSSTSTRCSAATPRSSAARRKSSTTAGRWARPTRSSRSTTSAPAASATPSPSWSTAPARGARFDLRKVPLEETGLAPKEIWCNESQERYVLALAPEALPLFDAMCERERCPFAVVGVATRRAHAGARRRRRRRARRSTCRWTCCSASRRRCTATCSASRAREAALDLTGVELQKVALRRAAPPDGGRASAS